MSSKILVSLFISVVFLDIMKIISSYDDCSLHFHALYNATENTSSDAYVTSEGAFLINVCAFNGFSWGFEPKTNRSDKSLIFTLDNFADDPLLVLEDGSLLLVGSFSLEQITKDFLRFLHWGLYAYLFQDSEDELKYFEV